MGTAKGGGGVISLGACITINETEHEAADPLPAIATAIDGNEPYLEIWLNKSEGKALSALINRDFAFLILMTPDCPEGWHSVSDVPGETSPQMLNFRLGNGQLDQFPKNWCVQRDSVKAVFEEYWQSERRPISIKWKYD